MENIVGELPEGIYFDGLITVAELLHEHDKILKRVMETRNNVIIIPIFLLGGVEIQHTKFFPLFSVVPVQCMKTFFLNKF